MPDRGDFLRAGDSALFIDRKQRRYLAAITVRDGKIEYDRLIDLPDGP